jgi:flagellar motor switch protein FliG
VRLRAEKKTVVEKLVAAFLENFRQEEELEKEAERLAEEHIQKAPGVDRHKVVQLIKQRLAEERRFVL